MAWQHVTRYEARDLLERHRLAGPTAALITTPQPGAVLVCPTCSSEARPDNEDTATCGACGTLSGLDTTVAYSNFIHHSLHYGARVRGALVGGAEDFEVSPASRPIPLLSSRVGSLVVLGALAGLRFAQLEEILTSQKALLQRWLVKELEEGDRTLAKSIPPGATAIEMADGAFGPRFAHLPPDFPTGTETHSPLRQVFQASCQYYKFRTSSIYVAYLADGILLEERKRLGLGLRDAVPWEELNPLVAALEGERKVPAPGTDRARAGEEHFTATLARFIDNKHRLLRAVFGRHRTTRLVTA